MSETKPNRILPDPRASVNDCQRRTRLPLYEAAEKFRAAIQMIDTTPEIKGEMTNLSIVNLRMALTVNDGCVSPFEMRLW